MPFAASEIVCSSAATVPAVVSVAQMRAQQPAVATLPLPVRTGAD